MKIRPSHWTRMVVLLQLAGMSLFGLNFYANAAKKYYPPGFTPPTNAEMQDDTSPKKTTPAKSENESPNKPTPVITQTVIKVVPQTIIKTVPVLVQPKPQDPLVAFMDERRFSEALRLVNQRLTHARNSIPLHLLRAQILREKHEFTAAEADYQWVIAKITKATPMAASLRAKAFAGLGLTQFENAMQTRHLGDIDASQSLVQDANSSFKQAVESDPTYPQVWTGIARLDLFTDNVQDAELAMRKAIHLAPGDPRVCLTQAQVLLEQNKPEGALPYIFKAKQQTPRDPEIYLLLGRSYLAMGRNDDALIQLKLALEKEPDNADALKLMSSAYAGKMKPDDAELALQKAVSLNPGDTEATMSLLKIYDQHGETERSRLLLQTLLKECPQESVYQLDLLQRFKKASQWDDLYDNGATFIAMQPANPAAITPTMKAIQSLFVEAAFAKSNGKINRQTFLAQPALQHFMAYLLQQYQANPVDLETRLNLLLLNPLVSLPAIPKYSEMGEDELLTAVKLADVEDNTAAYNQALPQLLAIVPSWSPDKTLEAAQSFLLLGNYPLALNLTQLVLNQQPSFQEALVLKKQIVETQAQAAQKRSNLEALSNKIPQQYWQDAAEEALRLAPVNDWQLHAFLAQTLLKRKLYHLAFTQTQLAIHYAPTGKEKEDLLKQQQKIQNKLTL